MVGASGCNKLISIINSIIKLFKFDLLIMLLSGFVSINSINELTTS